MYVITYPVIARVALLPAAAADCWRSEKASKRSWNLDGLPFLNQQQQKKWSQQQQLLTYLHLILTQVAALLIACCSLARWTVRYSRTYDGRWFRPDLRHLFSYVHSNVLNVSSNFHLYVVPFSFMPLAQMQCCTAIWASEDIRHLLGEEVWQRRIRDSELHVTAPNLDEPISRIFCNSWWRENRWSEIWQCRI